MPKFTEADTDTRRRIRDPRRRRPRVATITPEQVAAMLAEAGPDRDLVVKLSFHAGLRPGEMDELTEADVTIRDGRHYLTVRGRVPRTIALPRIVGDAVEAVRPGLQPGDLLVLPHLDAEGATARTMRRVLVTAGVTDATAHAPRGHLLDLLRTQHDLPLAYRLAYVGLQGSDPGTLPDGWSEPIADRIDELAANAAAG